MNHASHAVKALIYRSDGRILLQHRDNTPGLPFPDTWSFFGGLVEPGEGLKEALARELVEELGCLPGPIEAELFQWAWDGGDPTLNHVFPVRLCVEESRLELNEGQGMDWFSIQNLEHLNLTPLVTSQISIVSIFLSTCDFIDNTLNSRQYFSTF